MGRVSLLWSCLLTLLKGHQPLAFIKWGNWVVKNLPLVKNYAIK